ncbi:MAG: transcriptional regulator, partial [Thermoplasmata archaeon]
QSKGIVEIEPLPGKTFVRLLRHDFTFVGRRHQKKFIKRKRSRIAEKEEDENDIMFG